MKSYFDIDDEIIKTYQSNFQTFRKVSKMTCQDVANKIGVTKQTVSNIERGKVKVNKSYCILLMLVVDEVCETNEQLDKIAVALKLRR